MPHKVPRAVPRFISSSILSFIPRAISRAAIYSFPTRIFFFVLHVFQGANIIFPALFFLFSGHFFLDGFLGGGSSGSRAPGLILLYRGLFFVLP